MRAHTLAGICWFCRTAVTPAWLTCSRECATAWLSMARLAPRHDDGGPIFRMHELHQVHREARMEVR